jgi:glycine/D-amino acid oxidase-like deaminating enzyme
MRKNVIVVGAGIIGLALAYHLAKGGAAVQVIDALPKSGGVATPNSWAWINASWGNPEPYVKFRMRAMVEWRKLAAVHPLLAVNWCGGLLWDLPLDQLRNYAETQMTLGYSARIVDRAQARRLEPEVLEVPELAVHVAEEGSIGPAAAVAGFEKLAQSCGAIFLYGVKVDRLIEKLGDIVGVETSRGIIHADEVVIAAGAQTSALLSTLDITLKMDAPAGLLVHSEPAPKLLNGLVLAPELHMRQTTEGRLVAGSDFGGAQPGDDPVAAAAALFAKVQFSLRGAEKLKMDFYSLGYRPTPQDGLPAIGRVGGRQGLYVAVMHSGITLAPLVGSLAADEILNDVRDPMLSSYLPDRLIA